MTIELLTENKKKEKNTEEINITEFIEVKGWKAVGNRLSFDTVTKITMTSDKKGVPEPVVEEESVEDDLDMNENSNGSSPAANEMRDIEPPKTNGDSPQLNLL
jgi:topoisomerase-4 subunit A